MRAGFLLPALLLAVPVAREAQTPTPGETVIRGVVFDSLRMRPLAEATVQIAAATGTPWVRTYETDSRGTFEFTGVPPRRVRCATGADVGLGIMLDTIRVTSQRIFTRGLTDFDRRKRMGFGRFFDEKEIERRNPIFLTDLLRAISGVYVMPGQSGGDDVLMRGGLGGAAMCRPDLIIDGVRQINDATFPLGMQVWGNQLRAVEVYSRPSSVPVEFQSMTGCGAIVVWTGMNR
jgi:hypothetical protein